MADRKKPGILARQRVREMALIGLIGATALAANLPRELIEENIRLDKNALVATLALCVVIGLFLYLKFFFFLAEALLIAGANLPEQIAEGLGISKVPLILALVAMVGVSLVNYIVKVLPTGLEMRPRQQSAEAVEGMLEAIEKNDLISARKLLLMNFDANVHHASGRTPLSCAAEKGNPKMIELFLLCGADPRMTTREGDTPIELALRHGHSAVGELLRQARLKLDGHAAAQKPSATT